MSYRKAAVVLAIFGAFLQRSVLSSEQLTFTDDQLKKKPFYGALIKSVGGRPKKTYTAEEVLASENPKPATFTAVEVKTHFTIVGKLDPTKTHLFDKLIKKFGEKATYTADEVLAIESPTTTKIEKPPHKKSILAPPTIQPTDSFPKEEVRDHFKVEAGISPSPKPKATMDNLNSDFPDQTRYTAGQIRNVEKNGEDIVYTGLKRDQTQATFVAAEQAKTTRSWFLTGWKTPIIRHDWTDVVTTEDPSVSSDVAKSKVDDLVGATFSYTREANADTDTWTTVGSLIWPWVHNGPEVAGLIPPEIAVAPSVSVNRISTNAKGDPKTEVDQVLYRLGTYARWTEPLQKWDWLEDVQVRAAPVFGTDTGHEARMPGYELDVEAALFHNPGDGTEFPFKIGSKNILWPKEPLLEDSSDQSVLDYQIRVWMHLEGGDIQDTGKAFATTPGSFFRIGPVAQLRINSFFPVPLLSKGLSFTGQYSYLPTIDGPKGHDYLFNVTASLTILADKANHEKLSLTAGYTNGGLNFTKKDVDAFTLGLSVLF